ncbi:MAG: acylneuraminate cytidylyltransferase [Pseudomonadota bacterium]
MIGIQARSGSTRLPRKAFELISGKRLLDRVIDACKSGAQNIKKNSRGDVAPRVVVLTPEGDPIVEAFRHRCEIFEGPELDVLARYAGAAQAMEPDLIVRVTGDCPLLPPFVISKMVTLAVANGYDYVSNVDEAYRTALDGADCEVISTKLLDWLDAKAEAPADREHVTTLARAAPPEWARLGFVAHAFDHSHEKLSVDTPTDLEHVRARFAQGDDKYQRAVLRFGQQAVHKI